MWNKIFNSSLVKDAVFNGKAKSKPDNVNLNPSLGDKGESAAEGFLIRQGLKLIEKNYRCQRGELDLIMQDKESCVFVEVRLRKHSTFGSPAESVTLAKQQKLIAAAQHYLVAKGLSEKIACRFDVVSIIGDLKHNEKDLDIQWFKDAFST